jgi:hypothetical protein
MKAKKANQKELAARIIEKISEALEGVNEKAVKKVRRSTKNTASKLAKKFTATIDKISRKETKADKKQKKKSIKAEKKMQDKAGPPRKIPAKKTEAASKSLKAGNPTPATPSQATDSQVG